MTPDDITRLADKWESEAAGWQSLPKHMKASIGDAQARLACAAELRALAAQGKAGGVADALKELRALYRHHVNTLESARDQIIARGGECDAVDVMEMRCPVLKRVRDVLAATPPANPPEAGVTDTDRLNWIVDSWGKEPGPLHTAVTEAFRKEDIASVRAAIDAALAPQPKDAER